MNFNDFLPKTDLWEQLRSSDKRTVMYGMGNGADKILAVCENFGIEVCDFFASDGFVRGHSFHGKRVLSFSEIKEKYQVENINVLLSFGSCLPEVLENFKRIDSECTFFAPDVPVCGDVLFTLDFVKEHISEIETAYGYLEDEDSKDIFKNILLYKLTGKIRYLFDAQSDKDEVYLRSLDARNIKSYADLGAYNGDTIRELMRYAPSLERVVAFEPDRRSFRKLSEYCDTLSLPKIEKINAAAWSHATTLTFGDEGNRNSGLFSKAKSVEVRTASLDSVLSGRPIDYIKYDVEGCELEAIKGSEKTILSHKPRLLISVYHRNEDIFTLPLQIKAMRSDYKLYLRRYPYVPAWDLNLICI